MRVDDMRSMGARTVRPIPIPINTVSAVTGAGKQLILSKQVSGELLTVLTDLGLSINVLANSAFAVFYLSVDGSPVPDFNPITSQIAAANQPRQYDPAIPLGRVVKVELHGEILAGAPATPTDMVAQMTLAQIPLR